MSDVPNPPGDSPGAATQSPAVIEADPVDPTVPLQPADAIPLEPASNVGPDDDPTVRLRTRRSAGSGVLPVGPAEGMPIDPRMRERVVAVRRAQGRRRLRVLVAIAGVLVLLALAAGLTRSPILAVQHVRVSGDDHTSRASVLAVTGLDRHPQMIDLNSSRLRHELMALPWVASARIHRRWPATVEIRLVERVPVAQVAGPKGRPALVDRDGRVLASGSTAPSAAGSALPVALPAVNGAGQAGPPGAFLPQGSEARAALDLVVATEGALQTALPLPPGAPYRLQAVQIRRDGMLQANLTRGVTVLFGATDDLDAKLLALRTVLEQVPLRGLATLDVRVPTSPVLTHE